MGLFAKTPPKELRQFLCTLYQQDMYVAAAAYVKRHQLFCTVNYLATFIQV